MPYLAPVFFTNSQFGAKVRFYLLSPVATPPENDRYWPVSLIAV